jgi:delta-aminolevulinic acid dehydratase/porphobilinogen synthase
MMDGRTAAIREVLDKNGFEKDPYFSIFSKICLFILWTF